MSAIIEVDHLSKQYPRGPKALNDVSLSIDEGEIVAMPHGGEHPEQIGREDRVDIFQHLTVTLGTPHSHCERSEAIQEGLAQRPVAPGLLRR